MNLALKALVGAAAVVLIQFLSSTKNYYLAALVPLFPTFTLIAFYILGTERTTAEVNSTDSDGDGILDGQEDDDFDGRTNLEEYARGSDPSVSDAGSNVGVLSCAAALRGPAPWAAVAAFALISSVSLGIIAPLRGKDPHAERRIDPDGQASLTGSGYGVFRSRVAEA